jgi:hypothetical protein
MNSGVNYYLCSITFYETEGDGVRSADDVLFRIAGDGNSIQSQKANKKQQTHFHHVVKHSISSSLSCGSPAPNIQPNFRSG